ITDGQIFLQSDLFFSGVRPAINPGLSVSRVGGDAQIKAMKKVAGTLRLDLAAFRELEAFAQFGSGLEDDTQAKLNRGARTGGILKQNLNQPIVVEEQVMALYALTRGFLDDIPVEDIVRFEQEFYVWLDSNAAELLKSIRETGALADEQEMNGAVEGFKKTFLPTKQD